MPNITTPSPSESRTLALGPGCCHLPERLLLAHGRGEVLFITGAGTSMPAGLPDFRKLTLDVYQKLDGPLHSALVSVPAGVCNHWEISPANLKPYQIAEARRFIQGDYDVALGMLERRIDQTASPTTKVRTAISDILRGLSKQPAAIHKSLLSLSDRGGVTTIVTTNFDLLLEVAARHQKKKLQTYSLASIPRPGKSHDFAGVLHIHGALEASSDRTSHCIVTDRDFGEFYLRRQVVPEFIYDAARLFNIVLVGYSANDPPMRYLLNAVAADGVRFSDLKERYAFVSHRGQPDQIALNDWRARGIEPIPYDGDNGHSQLAKTMSIWAKLSAINGDQSLVESTVRRIALKSREDTPESDRDLFDHLYRRGSDAERRKLVSVVTRSGAGADWLDAILAIAKEPRTESSR